jgi:adenine-specific DNA-methyltransferase
MSKENSVKKIQPGDHESMSQDVIARNIDQLRSLLPDAWTDGKIDFEILKQLLGGSIDEREEKYGLNWYGKRRARQLALTPSTGTLRPCPDESVNWDKTKNLIIEGDNLEVLKLLQKSYTSRVKLIYIDPPYNTGKDFVYPDNYEDNLSTYLRYTGQISDEGLKLSTNTESSGRFHTNWLNMMYPRLKLARNLLRADGVIIISIDDNEVCQLKSICCEIFGEENFVACLPTVMNLKGNNDEFGFAGTHELSLVFMKDKESVEELGGIQLTEEEEAEYEQNDAKGIYKKGATLMRTGEAGAREKRPKGFYPIYVSADLTKMSLERHSNSDIEVFPRTRDGKDMSWRRSPETLAESFDEFIITSSGGSISFYKKQRLEEDRIRGKKPKSLFYKPSYSSGNGTDVIRKLFGDRVFNNPKPIELMRDFIMIGVPDEGIILDFFAGSASTAHACMLQNAVDGQRRNYILVQLPEPLDSKNREQKIALEYVKKHGLKPNLAELTKARLRLAAEDIDAQFAGVRGDTGFRVFKLDSSNINAWDPDRANLEQTLLDSMEHIKPDREENDVLYELLLKLGLDLCVPIEQKIIANKTVNSIGAGSLMVCLGTTISRDDAEPLALGIIEWNKQQNTAGDSTIVFRDSAFVDDVAKTNLAAILQQYGLENVRSL